MPINPEKGGCCNSLENPIGIETKEVYDLCDDIRTGCNSLENPIGIETGIGYRERATPHGCNSLENPIGIETWGGGDRYL